MFKDKEEALRRLEAELLREEEEEPRESEEWEETDDWDEEENWEAEPCEEWEEPSEEEPDPSPHVPDWRIYNADRVDEDLEEFSEQVYDPGRGTRGRWAAAAALILLAAVLLALAFLAARYGR